jgi:cytochrome c553
VRGYFFAAVISAVCSAALAQPEQLERLRSVQADPAALKLAVEAGRKQTFFCANCHGEDGISKSMDVPNLAGQNSAYLLEQIRKFSTGERKNQFMQGMIKLLKEEDRLNIAVYYATLPVRPTPADQVQVAKGKELFARLCIRCHGEQARGNEVFPRLAGQKLPYLKNSIINYRDNTGIRSNPLMKEVTASLKNEDALALANYLTQLP